MYACTVKQNDGSFARPPHPWFPVPGSVPGSRFGSRFPVRFRVPGSVPGTIRAWFGSGNHPISREKEGNPHEGGFPWGGSCKPLSGGYWPFLTSMAA